jgi:hypothetical protein
MIGAVDKRAMHALMIAAWPIFAVFRCRTTLLVIIIVRVRVAMTE